MGFISSLLFWSKINRSIDWISKQTDLKHLEKWKILICRPIIDFLQTCKKKTRCFRMEKIFLNFCVWIIFLLISEQFKNSKSINTIKEYHSDSRCDVHTILCNFPHCVELLYCVVYALFFLLNYFVNNNLDASCQTDLKQYFRNNYNADEMVVFLTGYGTCFLLNSYKCIRSRLTKDNHCNQKQTQKTLHNCGYTVHSSAQCTQYPNRMINRRKHL